MHALVNRELCGQVLEAFQIRLSLGTAGAPTMSSSELPESPANALMSVSISFTGEMRPP